MRDVNRDRVPGLHLLLAEVPVDGHLGRESPCAALTADPLRATGLFVRVAVAEVEPERAIISQHSPGLAEHSHERSDELDGHFFFYPLYRLVYLGLHQQNRFGTRETFKGLGQYGETLAGSEFLSGLRISASYVVYTVPLGIVLGVLLAVAANRYLRGI